MAAAFEDVYRMLETKGPGRAKPSRGTEHRIEARNGDSVASPRSLQHPGQVCGGQEVIVEHISVSREIPRRNFRVLNFPQADFWTTIGDSRRGREWLRRSSPLWSRVKRTLGLRGSFRLLIIVSLPVRR
jgi:hypothetical protein